MNKENSSFFQQKEYFLNLGLKTFSYKFPLKALKIHSKNRIILLQKALYKQDSSDSKAGAC